MSDNGDGKPNGKGKKGECNIEDFFRPDDEKLFKLTDSFKSVFPYELYLKLNNNLNLYKRTDYVYLIQHGDKIFVEYELLIGGVKRDKAV